MIKALRGTKDILSDEIPVWQFIEHSARDIFDIYVYKEIRTPLIEESNLFRRSVGDTTDIVQKEMYVFNDRGGRSIALRPEATASIVRAYIENSLNQPPSVVKLFYIGPMFRGERPQKGRQRQFHQIGVEAMGSESPLLDAEVISLAARFLEKLGIEKFNIRINSLGCHKDKLAIIGRYREMLKPYLKDLCDECKLRFEKNILRIFDCKDEKCKKVVKNIKAENVLCNECTDHFNSVKKNLDLVGIPYTIDTKIVRGLDYYTKTVFELTQDELGAKDAICAGGRYNNLIKALGGKDTPAIGFAFGIERLVIALENNFNKDKISSAHPFIFIAVINEELHPEAFKLMDRLRKNGISGEMDYEGKNLTSQLRTAERLGVRFVVIFGENEFRNAEVLLKDMQKREQREVGLDKIVNELNILRAGP